MMGRVNSGCPVCSDETIPWAKARVLDGRHEASYERCRGCGLVRAVDVDWLDDAYAQAITDADIGLLDRCTVLSHVTASVLARLRLGGGAYLDWAGGYGVFTRMMRDRGYDFCDYDPYARSLFAGGHRLDALPVDAEFDAVTAFEVLEHLVDPVTELKEVSTLSDVLLTTTQVLPDPAPKPGEWDYYSLQTGQHVTFYTQAALHILGERLGYEHVASGPLVHLFSRQAPVRRSAAAVVRRHQLAYLGGFLASVPQRRKSLLAKDAAALS